MISQEYASVYLLLSSFIFHMKVWIASSRIFMNIKAKDLWNRSGTNVFVLISNRIRS